MPICSKLPQLHKVPVSQCLYSLCQVFGEGAIFPENKPLVPEYTSKTQGTRGISIE